VTDAQPTSTPSASRRTVLHGAAAAGVLAVGGSALSGCASGPAKSSDGPSKKTTLGAADEIKVGGGKVYDKDGVVVVRTADTEYRAFSAVCTHRGCTVNEVADGVIKCPCHQSHFSVKDGSVKAGPAEAPLPKVELAVRNGKLIAGPGAAESA
jgi:Rieske Fe-S protein